jgi:hypothetical protein
MKIYCRIYIEGALAMTDTIEGTEGEMMEQIRALAGKHIRRIMEQESRKFMVEIEDPGLPEGKRCLRFGTDASLMVQPIPVFQERGQHERE